MKQFTLIVITLLITLAGCKKEEISNINPPTISSMSGNWSLSEQIPGQPLSVKTINLAHDLSVTGGHWSLTGTTFTMTRYTYSYTGTVSNSGITGSISPSGTFTMVR